MNLKKVAVSALVALQVLGSSLGASQVLAQDGVKVGGNFELTGETASYGTPMSEGTKLAIKQRNAAGGVLGAEVEYVEYDNKSDLTESASVATRLAEEGVTGVVGPAPSGDVRAQIPVLEEAGVPNIAPAATVDNITQNDQGEVFDYFFRVCFEDAYQGTAGGKFAAESLGGQTAAIVTDQSSDYSLGLTDAFKTSFTEAGGQIVSEQSIQAGESDFSAVLTTLLAQEFDVLYLPIYYTEAGLFIKQAREFGLTQPILGGDGFHSPTLVELAGAENANDLYYTSHFSPLADSDKVNEFMAAFEEEYGKEADTFAALAYDATNLLLDAVERAGSNDRDAVTQAIAETTDFEGVTGTFSIDELHNPVKPALMLEVQGGEVVNTTEVSAE